VSTNFTIRAWRNFTFFEKFFKKFSNEAFF